MFQASEELITKQVEEAISKHYSTQRNGQSEELWGPTGRKAHVQAGVCRGSDCHCPLWKVNMARALCQCLQGCDVGKQSTIRKNQWF